MAGFARGKADQQRSPFQGIGAVSIERLEQRQYMSAAFFAEPAPHAVAAAPNAEHHAGPSAASVLEELKAQRKAAATLHHVAALERSIVHFEGEIRQEVRQHPRKAANVHFQQHIAKQQVNFAKRIARAGGLYTPIAFADLAVAAAPTPGVGAPPVVATVPPAVLPPAPVPAPNPPSATAASASEVDLSWSAIAGADGYLVERSADGGMTWNTLASASLNGGSDAYADTTVSAGTTYSYRISAMDAAGTSAASPAETVLTLPATPVVSASPISPTEIDLSWTATVGATSYTMQTSVDGGNTWTTLGTTSEPAWSNTALLANTSYEYRVSATNAAGTSAISAAAIASTLEAPPIQTPGSPTPGGSSPKTPTTPATPPSNSAWAMTANPKLPNVLILGDSISIGYTLDVRSLLKGKANVYRPLNAAGTDAENCGGTTFGLSQIDQWLDAGPKWNVIHFNFGLHDLEHVASPGVDTPSPNLNDPVLTTPAQYRINLEAIVRKLKATGAKLIFATTTPVPQGAIGRTPDEPAVYNAIALQIMQANGIAVDDLNSYISPNLAKYQQPQSVHYTSAGCSALAQQVARSVESELPAI